MVPTFLPLGSSVSTQWIRLIVRWNLESSQSHLSNAPKIKSISHLVYEISQNEQNTVFKSSTTVFLDFSEDNPFGDPENN